MCVCVCVCVCVCETDAYCTCCSRQARRGRLVLRLVTADAEKTRQKIRALHMTLVHAWPYPSIPCADANARRSPTSEVLSSAPSVWVCVGEVDHFTTERHETVDFVSTDCGSGSDPY